MDKVTEAEMAITMAMVGLAPPLHRTACQFFSLRHFAQGPCLCIASLSLLKPILAVVVVLHCCVSGLMAYPLL